MIQEKHRPVKSSIIIAVQKKLLNSNSLVSLFNKYGWDIIIIQTLILFSSNYYSLVNICMICDQDYCCCPKTL